MILGVSEIRISSVFHKRKSSFSSILKFIKKNFSGRYYDILHPVARIIQQCLFESYFLLFSVCLPSYAFHLKSTEFEFEFALRIPSVC